jgi:hypothetical protein
MMQRLVRKVTERWTRAARSRLGSRRANAYIRAMRVEPTQHGFRLALRSTRAMMLELGMGPGGIGTQGPYDMRKVLLRPGTRSVRRSKDGHLYLHVPFRMTKAKIVALGGHGAYTAAHALQATTTITTGSGRRTVTWGRDLRTGKHSALPAGMAMRQPGHATDRLARTYKFHRLEHLVRGGPVRATYGNFRTISDGPKGKPWMHPGVRAHRIMLEVMRDAGRLMREAMRR